MTEIQIMNAMNQSVINKITEFKNKEIKKEELNNFMFANLSYILKQRKKIKKRNEKIKKGQDMEVKKALAKVKSFNGILVFNSDELESKPIMNKLVNPTLDVYIPLSEISYTTEMKMYNESSGTNLFNEEILVKNQDLIETETDDKVDKEEKQILFEEPPITFIKFQNDFKKIQYGDEYLNAMSDNLIQIINKSDEDLINKKEGNEEYNTNLFYELINSFDEGDKEDFNYTGIDLDFKKFKSTFYLDDYNLNRKSYKRNSYENYINLSTFSKSTSSESYSRSVGGSLVITKNVYESEFANYMTHDAFKKNVKHMSIDYLRYMRVLYSDTMTKSKKFFYCEDKMFLSCMKSFLLKLGVSSKKLYEKIFQSFENVKEKKKDNICSFQNFLKIFTQILKLKEENTVLKYKFILSLFRLGEEDLNVKHVNIFMQLLKGESVYDSELWDELNKNLVQRYDRIYPNDPEKSFRFDKMLICLETFFDKTGMH